MDPGNDFIGDNIVTTFSDGSVSSNATAIITNDAVPETNETFILSIVGLSSGTIGSPSTMRLIIRANDGHYGFFQFEAVSDIR